MQDRGPVEGIRRILAFCLPGIGDSLFAVPALRALKEQYSDSTLSALTMFRGAADVLQQFPFIDEVVIFDFLHEGFLRSLRFLAQLRKCKFDLIFMAYPSNRLEYNLIGLFMGARYRLGRRYQHLDYLCGNWLKNLVVGEDTNLTNVEENLRLTRLVTGKKYTDSSISLPLQPIHIEYARKWAVEQKLSNRLLIGFHPGGSTAKNHLHKRWPAHKYVDLGKNLIRETGAAILLPGGPEKDQMKQRIAEDIGLGAFVAHPPDILHTCGLIAQCSHVVANDTALLHLSRALGVPTTGIFGPTSSAWVGIPHVSCNDLSLGLPCQPCFYYSPRHLRCKRGSFQCLHDLTPDLVADRFLALLEQRNKISRGV